MKLQDFQFRLLHYALVTNKDLKIWGLRENDDCNLCNLHQETIEHLMLECQYSRTLWEDLLAFIREKSGVYISFTDKEKIFCVTDCQYAHFFNLVFMILKQYLYACRCLGKLTHVMFQNIVDAKETEKCIYIKNNRVQINERKWGSY